ncbi:hypothetical protein A8709_06375 [Paenibacillus pectinilyticus]|uniref:SLH domain-containing protein n=1 Tax=Paenibacillus pectinilyticus TaxID=512399 RepID=A0A1C0ZT94_9BACL|nr:S-layer homology domain-containing protein [Paenibacillus pectinilyticus]OCT11298.1 hypothetical protein A8709_06375 [Paenibacillus pectinilyticus]
MKHRSKKLVIQLAMIAIMLLANLPMYSGHAGATSLTPGVFVSENTDSAATLVVNTNSISLEATFGIMLGKLEDMSDSQPVEVEGQSTSTQRYAHLSSLTPGTTYYFYAYAQEGVTRYTSTINSFTTAAIQGIDVTDLSGIPYAKNLVTSSNTQNVYSVHVPFNTNSVKVSESVNLGTAYVFLPLEFAKVGSPSLTKTWTTPIDRVTSATYSVDLTPALVSSLTTVCVKNPIFGGPAGQSPTINSCDNYPYEIQIIRDAPTVETQTIQINTFTNATLKGYATGFDHESTKVKFQVSPHEDMSESRNPDGFWYNNDINSFIDDLTPGTTYYYRAYAQEFDGDVAVGPAVYGDIKTFSTASFTGIDVKDSQQNIFAKSPSSFNINTKQYTVHVPYNTLSVNVSQNVYTGTAPLPLMRAKFAVVNLDTFSQQEDWSLPVSGNITATHQVTLSSSLTTVCVTAPRFSVVSNVEGPIHSCSDSQYEVQIIRDAAPQAAPETPKTVKVIVTEQGGNVANVPVTQLGESKLPMSAQLFTKEGTALNLPEIAIKADGTFTLPNVPAGQYQMVLSVVAPTGEKLAGRPATLTVDASGNAQIESELIDPYGIITDAVTGKAIAGAHATLHWADTALNRSKGRTIDGLVVLPILPDFAPNQNKDPQDSNAKGEYGWMVFPNGDYYVRATKEGYTDFDSRTTGANKDAGKDSYIENGVIHIGQAIESYDFTMEPIAKEKGTHNNYIAGYPDGTFGPDRNITRAEVAAVFARITNNYQLVLNASDANSFNDVSSSHWAKEYIESVRASGLMLGVTDSSFLPESPITRGEVAAIIARFKKLAPVEEPLFSDTLDYWASSAINAVKKANIIDGYGDGTFLPNQKIVRKEFVVMINRMLGRGKFQPMTQSTWSDVPVTDFYFADIQEASTTHNYAIYEDAIERLK